MNIAGAHSADKNLYDVQNVFVQIEDEESCKSSVQEEEAFTNEYAKDYCSYTFWGAVERKKAAGCWVRPVIPVRTMSWIHLRH